MRFLVHTTAQLALDLALEEALHLGLEDGSSLPTWRVWQAVQPGLVLGTGQVADREVHLDVASKLSVPVLRRHSGGGAVLVGPGVINYSGFLRIAELPGAQTITGAMCAALRPVREALNRLGVRTCEAGLSDLVVEGEGGSVRKIAGNAQARKRVSVVVHGTLLAHPDWALLEGLLRFPSRAPDYRVGRAHRDFLTCLSELGVAHDLHAFAEALSGALGGEWSASPGPTADEAARAEDLFQRKYNQSAWNLRR